MQAKQETKKIKESKEAIFSFSMNDALLFKKIMDSVRSIVLDAKFSVSEKGIGLIAMDAHRSCQIELELPTEVFDESHLLKDGLFVGLNVDEISSLLQGISKNTNIELRVFKDGWIGISLENASSRKSFRIPSVDLGGKEVRKLDIPFQFRAELTTKLYQEIIRFLKLGSDQAVFLANEEELVIESSTSTRINKMMIPRDSAGVIQYKLDLEDKEKVKACYSVLFLQKFAAGTKISDAMFLEFSSDKPLKLTFPIPGGGHLAYAVAPRLEY